MAYDEDSNSQNYYKVSLNYLLHMFSFPDQYRIK